MFHLKLHILRENPIIIFILAFIAAGCNKETDKAAMSPVFVHNGKLLMEGAAESGAFVITDNTLQTGSQYSLKKISETGSIEWSRFVADEIKTAGDTPQFSLRVKGIIESGDGCFIAIDSVDQSNDFERFFVFKKYDNAGNFIGGIYDPLFFEDFHYLDGQAVTDGSIIYGASYRSRVINVDKFMMLASINSRGETLWRQFVKITEYPVGDLTINYGRIILTNDNGIIVMLNGIGEHSAYILKFDVSGNLLWQKDNNSLVTSDAPEGGLLPYFSDVIEDNEGNIVMLGMKLENLVNDIYLLKLDANGNELWDTSYSNFGYDYGYSLIQASNSEYVLTGFNDRIGNTEFDINLETSKIFIIRMTAKGEIIWEREYAKEGAIGKITAETSGGNLVSIGRKISFGNILNEDLVIIRTDGNGELQ